MYLVGHVCLYGVFSATELGLAFLTVACVHNEFPLRSHCFCSVKVVVLYTASDVRERSKRNH